MREKGGDESFGQDQRTDNDHSFRRLWFSICRIKFDRSICGFWSSCWGSFLCFKTAAATADSQSCTFKKEKLLFFFQSKADLGKARKNGREKRIDLRCSCYCVDWPGLKSASRQLVQVDAAVAVVVLLVASPEEYSTVTAGDADVKQKAVVSLFSAVLFDSVLFAHLKADKQWWSQVHATTHQ